MSGAASIRPLLLRLLVSAILVSLLLFAAGERVARTFVPVYWQVSCALLPEHRCEVSVDAAKGEIRLDVITEAPRAVAGGRTLPAGVPAYATTDLSNALLPALLVLIIVAGWPAVGVRQHLLLLPAAVLALLLAQAVTVPVLLAGTVLATETSFAGGDPARLDSPLKLWYLALNNGGVFMAAVFSALAAVTLTLPLRARHAGEQA